MFNWKTITAIVMAVFLYTAGYNSAKSSYLEIGLEERNLLVKEYEEQINEIKRRQLEVEAQAERYRNDAKLVSDDANRLREQLKLIRTRKGYDNKSNSTTRADSRWDAKMADALRFATDLIEERDRIALQYNELRKSCVVL